MSTDMTGRKVREPGRAGERYREARERRARESRKRREKFWAARMEAAESPLQAFKVAVDRLSTAVVQRERRAAVAYDRVHRAQPGSRQDLAAKTRLDKTRAATTADLVWLMEQVLEIAANHETTRV
jgi:predicted secreted Zn-dependent protease